MYLDNLNFRCGLKACDYSPFIETHRSRFVEYPSQFVRSSLLARYSWLAKGVHFSQWRFSDHLHVFTNSQPLITFTVPMDKLPKEHYCASLYCQWSFAWHCGGPELSYCFSHWLSWREPRCCCCRTLASLLARLIRLFTEGLGKL